MGRSDWLAQLEGRARCTGASEMDRPSSSSASTLSLSSEMAFRAAEIDLHARPDVTRCARILRTEASAEAHGRELLLMVRAHLLVGDCKFEP